MKKKLLFVFLLCLSLEDYAQSKKYNIKSIGISIPIIWNTSEATYYSLGNRREPNGKGTSYGINLNYSRTVYKNIFGIFGIGYFKQSFGIERPFNYVTPDSTKPLIYTKTYAYSNIYIFIGIGYKKSITKNLAINGTVVYNMYNSYTQKYAPENYFAGVKQINHKSLSIGNSMNLNIGLERQVTKKISIGFDFLLPISTHWNNDEIFYKYNYSNDTQQIGRNKFAMGTTLSCNYHF